MKTLQETDVVVIGAGAIGSAIARELSKYDVKVVLVEKKEDIGGDASRTNSATIISGYDSPPGTLESKLATASNPMFDQLAEELDVEFKRIGALQVAYTDEDLAKLKESKKKAIANGILDVSLISAAKVRELEPNLSPDIKGGMLIPKESIIDLFDLMVAYVENAVDNGVELMLSTKVQDIRTDNGKVVSVVTNNGEIATKYVINAAALYADEIAKTVGLDDFRNYPRKGEFFILDKNVDYAPNRIIAPIPSELTRGKLITPSVHGNLIVGPTAENLEDKEDKSTTRHGLDEILAEVHKMIPEINPKDSITQFAGLRPARTPAEYSIRAFEELKGYIEVNGISQGISCSPGVAIHVANLLTEEGLDLVEKDDFNPYRKGIVKFRECTREEQADLIKEDPRYGNIICRCETVTEAEIVQAVLRNPPARSLDAVKRRLRAGMGRCQGGFCSPRIVEIIARELNISPEEVRKNEAGSEILTGKNK